MSHKATPEQWNYQDQAAFENDSTAACILELRDTLAALEQRVQALEPRPWIRPQTPTEIDEGMRKAFREAIADGVVHPVPHGPAPAADPAPAPAGSLVEAVAALVANGISCDRDEERIAADAIAAVAEWLELRHTGRIANGSQFADLLREALEREVGR